MIYRIKGETEMQIIGNKMYICVYDFTLKDIRALSEFGFTIIDIDPRKMIAEMTRDEA